MTSRTRRSLRLRRPCSSQRCLPTLFFPTVVMARLTFSTLNVNSIRIPVKRHSLATFMVSRHLDIIGLQETHWETEEEAKTWARDFPTMDLFSSFGTSKQNGVTIAIAKRLRATVSIRNRDTRGRFLSLNIDIDGCSYTVSCLYSPRTSRERDVFLSTVVEPALTSRRHILLGDFNTVFDPALDRNTSTYVRPDPSSRQLTRLVESNGMRDLFRLLHPSDRAYTWKRPNNLQMSCIDMIFATGDLASDIDSITITPWQWSDHSLVLASLAVPRATSRGPGFWKLNVSILNDSDYCSSVQSFWTDWRTQRHRFPDCILWWETGKAYLRDLSRQFCQQRTRERRRRRLDLECQLVRFRQQVTDGDPLANVDLAAVERQLRELDEIAIGGARVRSRIQWSEEGEKSSKFFFGLESRRQKEGLLNEVVDGTGRSCTTTPTMLEAVASFYDELFGPPCLQGEHTDRLLESITASLDDSDRELLDRPLDAEEIYLSMRSMSTNKSPGIDGLSLEFYRQFWPLLADDLLVVYNEVLQRGILGPTQRTGVVRLIYKKGDRRNLKNWRPITLLTVDYKILAKTFARRLTRVLPSIVHEDQTCGVPGRSIHDNCRLLQDVVDYCESRQIPAALVSLDQLKAFDRVSWQFLDLVLARMNFGTHFRHCIASLYRDASSRVLVNGWLSRRVNPHRGVRQGCPLSPILYVLVAETLGGLVRASPLVGLPLPGGDGRAKISQYADDTTVVVTCNADFDILTDCLACYELGSGAKLNMDKSRGLFVGPWKLRIDVPLSLSWTTDHLRLLGVLIGSDPNLNTAMWQEAVDKMENVFRVWKHRDLSMLGRSLIARALATSKLWYVARVIPPPPRLLDRVNSTVWHFIWSDHTELVNRRTCSRPPREGGLGGVLIKEKVEAFHLQWIARLVDGRPAKWKSFAFHWLDIAGTPFTDHRGLLDGNRTVIRETLPAFYSNLIRLYRHYGGKGAEPATGADVLAQPLFGNPAVVDATGRPFYSNILATAGITTIGDIRDGSGWADAARLPCCRRTAATRVLGRIRTAIPDGWLLLSGSELSPLTLSVAICPGPRVSLVPKSLYSGLMAAMAIEPLGVGRWRSQVGYSVFCSALQSMRTAGLSTAYSKDIAFKYLHRVLPTPARLHRFRMAPSSVCRVCSHPVATLDHLFKRCPKARRLRLPLRRILSALYEPVLPSNVTLWSAPFLPCLSRCRPASFVVWCFIVIYWRFHLSHTLPAIISILAANIRQAIVADWHSARRHRSPDIEFFKSQWMPPGRPRHVCCVDGDHVLTIRLSPFLHT